MDRLDWVFLAVVLLLPLGFITVVNLFLGVSQ